ncbi:hypothetical protein PG994_000818 [Apiospora phragmitis]|uniref:Uncharacterized protein n=1 Tax=Apiospora phragmitis TaxID=2905665 RepID=A0ABR1X7A4_9PEZI
MVVASGRPSPAPKVTVVGSYPSPKVIVVAGARSQPGQNSPKASAEDCATPPGAPSMFKVAGGAPPPISPIVNLVGCAPPPIPGGGKTIVVGSGAAVGKVKVKGGVFPSAGPKVKMMGLFPPPYPPRTNAVGDAPPVIGKVMVVGGNEKGSEVIEGCAECDNRPGRARISQGDRCVQVRRESNDHPGPSGGPWLTLGQGGRVRLRVVVPPLPLGNGTPMGGISTLG